MSRIVKLGKSVPERALEGLNRLTGLVFESWPESLLGSDIERQAEKEVRSVAEVRELSPPSKRAGKR
jgi:hypothetical protein